MNKSEYWIDSPPFECSKCASPAGIVPVADAATSLASSWDIQIVQVPIDAMLISYSNSFVSKWKFTVPPLHHFRQLVCFPLRVGPGLPLAFDPGKYTSFGEICCPVDILLYLGPSSVILLALCCFFAWFADDGYQVIVIWSPEIRHWDSHPIDNGSHECHLNQGRVPKLETSLNFRLSNVVASFERSAKDCRASCFNSCSSRYIKLQTACLKCLNC